MKSVLIGELEKNIRITSFYDIEKLSNRKKTDRFILGIKSSQLFF